MDHTAIYVVGHVLSWIKTFSQNSSDHLTSIYSGHYVCGDAASDTIRTRALIDQGEHQLKSTKYLNFRLGIHTTVQSWLAMIQWIRNSKSQVKQSIKLFFRFESPTWISNLKWDLENTELPVSRSNDFTSQQISGAFTQIDFSENSRTRKGRGKNESTVSSYIM